MARRRRRKPKPRRKPKLTRAQREARKTRAMRRDLYDPSKTLSGDNLRRSIDEIVNNEFEPSIRSVNRGVSTARAQGRVVSDRAGAQYQRLAQQEAQSLAASNAIGSRLSGELSQIGNDTQRQFGENQQQVDQSRAQDASLRGEGLQGTARAGQELAAQRALAAQQSATTRAAGASQTANYGQLSLGRAGANRSRAGERQGDIASSTLKAINELLGKRTDIVSQRGSARTKLLLDLRDKGFEQIATNAGLGLKGAGLAQDAVEANQRSSDKSKDRKSREQIARERIAAQKRGQDISGSKGGGSSGGGSSGGGRTRKGAFTPAQRRSNKVKLDRALANIRNNPGHSTGYYMKLAEKKGFPPYLMEVALARHRKGGVSSATARRLMRDYGIRVKVRRAKRRRKKRGGGPLGAVQELFR